MSRIISLICILLLLIAAGCSNDTREQAEGPSVVGSKVDVPAEKAVVEGSIGNGSTYALHCPDDWNGDLVVYAHGYAFPETEPALPDANDPGFVAFRDALMDMGYGVAFSSFSQTGWSVKQGIIETRQLRGLFASQFGMPDRTFLVGTSMGGLISIALAEKNAGLYDGAMPMCGVLGGADMAVDYIYNVRALFDYFYPGVLPGSATEIPEGFHWSQAQGLAYLAIVGNPYPAFEMAGVDPVNVQYQSPEELINAILTAIVFHTASVEDFIDRTHGHDFFDNMDVVYSGSGDDAALNAGVDRFSSTPDAENFIRHYYEPKGKLRIPVVTLHTTRDQVVQIFNEHDYAAKVEALGGSDLLTQFEIDRFGHCAFTLDEMLGAFAELVDQVDAMDQGNARLAKR